MFYISGLPSFLLCIVCIVTITGLSSFGLVMFRLIFPKPVLNREENRAAGSICTIIGGLFGLLLALILVTVWQDYKSQKEKVIDEAVVLASLYRDTSAFKNIYRDSIHAAIKQYTNDVIFDSWPKMKEGRESDVSWNSFNKLYSLILHYPVVDSEDQILKGHMIENLNEIAVLRRQRVFRATESAIPAGLWYVIFIGAATSISSTYYFYISNFKIQMLLTLMHSGMIAITIYLVISLMFPFRSGMSIQPVPFTKLQQQVFPVVDQIY